MLAGRRRHCNTRIGRVKCRSNANGGESRVASLNAWSRLGVVNRDKQARVLAVLQVTVSGLQTSSVPSHSRVGPRVEWKAPRGR